MTTYLIGELLPTVNGIEAKNKCPIKLEDLGCNLSQVQFAYQSMVYHIKNYSKIWLSGYYDRYAFAVNEVSYDKLVEINCIHAKETKIKKLFVNVMSESIFYITTDDKIYGIGNNSDGQLGIGSNSPTKGPQLISALNNVVDIKSTEYCSLALCESDHDDETAKIVISYWMRLYNFPNDIGSLIMIFSKKISVLSTDFSGHGENGHGEPVCSEYEYRWKEIAALKDVEIVELSAGDNHTLFLDITGNVWSCGKNFSSQLGLGDDSSAKYVPTLIEYFKNNCIRIQKIASGTNHNLALDYNGNVYVWGENSEYQCGFNQIEDISTPKQLPFDRIIQDIQCGANHSYCKSVDGKHYLFGRNRRRECLIGMNDGGAENNYIQTPRCINDILEKQYKNTKIKSIKLGYEITSFTLVQHT